MKEKNIDNSSQIFKYLNPTSNDKISNMSGPDLQNILYYLEEYYLELRNKLGISKDKTFGLELEFEKARLNKIEEELKKVGLEENWEVKKDLSIRNGGEVASPILRDTESDWKTLEKVCDILDKNARIEGNCGGHIHVGIQALGTNKQAWINLINLWSTYENIIYRFAYGDSLNARYTIKKFATPIALKLKQDYKRLLKYESQGFLETRDILYTISYKRCQAINFYNVKLKEDELKNSLNNKNTIEFRCPNGTLDPIIWQNNTNFFTKMLNYVNSTDYNNDIVENRKRINENKYINLYWYSQIFLQQSLELCDMIFTNNLDKIYFLKQYLKNFEINERVNIKAKTFTKKQY